MIIYLAVTALVNIALGYALAMYLGPIGRKRTAAAAAPQEYADPDYHAPIESYEEPPAEELTGAASPAAASLQRPAAPAPTIESVAPPTPPPAPTPIAATTPEAKAVPEVEDNLLAGINEFRNQLAQMKDVAEVEAPATPEPALAAASAPGSARG